MPRPSVSSLKMVAIASILFIFPGAVASHARSPSKILSRASKALGGEGVLRNITSLQRSGTILRISDGATGRFTAVTASPGQYGMTFDVGGVESSRGFNGKSGWVRDFKAGVRTLTGDDAKLFQAEAAYRSSLWLKARAEKSKVTTLPDSTIGGKMASGVLLTTAKGIQMKIWFDSASGLPIKDEIGSRSMEYADYRLVNGVNTPFFLKMTDGGDVYDIKLDDIKYNVRIDRTALEFPSDTNSPLPDITGLLAKLRENADKIDDILEDYSYTELRIDRELNGAGQLVEKSSEKRLLTFYKGYRINRLVEKDGKPLSASDQEREDRDAQKQVADIDDRIAKREARNAKRAQRDTGSDSTGRPNGEGQRISIADALKGSVLQNPRRESFRGRPVIVFDYEPDPNFKPQTRNEKLFSICSGTVWVDEALKQVVRLDATLTKSAGNFIAKAKSGASFSIDNELVNSEIWLPSQADVNVSIKILFAGININNLIKYGDYRKFSTEVKGASVDDPPKKN